MFVFECCQNAKCLSFARLGIGEQNGTRADDSSVQLGLGNVSGRQPGGHRRRHHPAAHPRQAQRGQNRLDYFFVGLT